MISTALVVEVVVRAGVAIRVIMSRRPVPAALTWLVLLLLPVPLVPFFLYLLVGENRLGSRRLARYRKITADFATRAQVFLAALSQDWTPELAPYRPLADVLTQVGDIPPLRRNRIEFIAGSEKFIDLLIADIDAATSRVHLLFYIWMHEGAGVRLVEAVERAARRGIPCRVIVDSVGSKQFLRAGLDERLIEAGVKFAAALPASPLRMLFARVDLRNHRKIAVIDGRTAWSGSSNITDDSFGYRPVRRVGPSVDAMARVVGPAAQALDAVFLRDWLTETSDEDASEIQELLHLVPEEPDGCPVQVVPTGPDTGPATMRDALVTAIFAAREELIMTTPYFVPDEATKEALIAAAMRGVRVTLVMPRHLDNLTVGAASRSHFIDLLRAGVRIHLHRVGLLHSKTITIDSDVAMIGSHNLDQRSFTLNFEVSLFIYDSEQTSLLRMLQTQYLSESDEIFAQEWAKRPVLKRFIENCARLCGPLL